MLYIIKPQEDARWRVMRYKGGKPPLMIYAALRVAMIYQACGLDKKSDAFASDFLSMGYKKDIFRGLILGFELKLGL
ncbi:MAG: hypothetical protein IKD31_03990, partial [Clostridia bacterium]|nr:hypothetical protein [Clostridia bacterium]